MVKNNKIGQYFTKFRGKTVGNGYKSTFMNNEIKSTMNTRGNLHIFIKYFFPTGRSTKHSVDRLSADYIGFYRQGSGKLDKYGFVLLSV